MRDNASQDGKGAGRRGLASPCRFKVKQSLRPYASFPGKRPSASEGCLSLEIPRHVRETFGPDVFAPPRAEREGPLAGERALTLANPRCRDSGRAVHPSHPGLFLPRAGRRGFPARLPADHADEFRRKDGRKPAPRKGSTARTRAARHLVFCPHPSPVHPDATSPSRQPLFPHVFPCHAPRSPPSRTPPSPLAARRHPVFATPHRHPPPHQPLPRCGTGHRPWSRRPPPSFLLRHLFATPAPSFRLPCLTRRPSRGRGRFRFLPSAAAPVSLHRHPIPPPAGTSISSPVGSSHRPGPCSFLSRRPPPSSAAGFSRSSPRRPFLVSSPVDRCGGSSGRLRRPDGDRASHRPVSSRKDTILPSAGHPAPAAPPRATGRRHHPSHRRSG